MPDDRFESLSKVLFECGIEARFAGRIGAELEDHYADLEQEALAANRTPEEASAEALARLGEEAVIAEEFLKRPELRAWIYRFAWIVRCLDLLFSVLMLALTPLQALVDRRVVLARYCAAVGAASILTLALLLTLQFATRSPPGEQRLARVGLTESGTAVFVEEIVTVNDRSRPRRPEDVDQRPGQPADYQVQTLADVSRAVDIKPSVLDLVPPGLVDGDYLPIVKAAPSYPAVAASRGIEGYVVVEFTVTPAGTVRDVVVVESSSDLFHQAAIDATSKFKYKPRVVSGRPVEVSGVRNRITFALEA